MIEKAIDKKHYMGSTIAKDNYAILRKSHLKLHDHFYRTLYQYPTHKKWLWSNKLDLEIVNL
uniref:Uncharacterized protein n=1 Tax=Rhizophagus irregularis (strain DAOM 181602 / DAOM 197198 / MUCL 43194) TaxID=747089 RepID=U9USD4_RHIID